MLDTSVDIDGLSGIGCGHQHWLCHERFNGTIFDREFVGFLDDRRNLCYSMGILDQLEQSQASALTSSS